MDVDLAGGAADNGDAAMEQGDDESPAPPELKEEETAAEQETPSSSSCEETMSESKKRRRMILDELNQLIKDTEDKELEDDMDDDVKIALQKAALQICFRHKYFDVISDNIIYFPSVIKTAVNYKLIEKAEEYYYDEDDEFPMEYSAAIRSVATEALGDDEETGDQGTYENFITLNHYIWH
jgi:hypothetical protein